MEIPANHCNEELTVPCTEIRRDKKRVKIFTSVILIFLFGCGGGGSIRTDTESVKSDAAVLPPDDARNRTVRDGVFLETELNRKSQDYYERLLGSSDYDLIVYDHKLTLMKKAASKLSVAMGYGYYKDSHIHLVKYKKDPSALNAFALPSGQIFVYEALAELLEKKAKELSNGSAEDESRILENLFAAVIGHEIGHYYGKHQLKSAIRKMSRLSAEQKLDEIKKTDLKNAQILIDDVENEQNYEIQSDWFAVTSMGKAGYDPSFMETVLAILKEKLAPGNPYLSTHPSMNKRIAYITKDPEKQKRLVERIVNLEYAFAAVETGYQLKEATIPIKQELERMPDNPYLLSALAKVYHRLWEESCEISDLRFKSSIIYSPFQEGMIHPATRGKEGLTRKYWCNRSDYETALNYYSLAIKNFAGPYTLTSYAVLLSYHPDKADYSAAAIYAKRAFEEIPDDDGNGKLRALNNLAIVFFMNEKFEESAALFAMAANRSLEKLTAGQYDPAAESILRGLSGKNTGILLEAFYNLGSVYKELSDLNQFSNIRQKLIDKASEIWRSYVMLDTDSQWGKYALAYLGNTVDKKDLVYVKPKVLLEIRITDPNRKESFEKHEITIGSSEDDIRFLKESKGENNFARGMARGLSKGFARGFARGFSMGLTVSVLDSKLIGIRLDQVNSYPVRIDGKSGLITVGMEQTALEQILGKPSVTIGDTLFYPNYFSIFRIDSKGRINSISIQETLKK